MIPTASRETQLEVKGTTAAHFYPLYDLSIR